MSVSNINLFGDRRPCWSRASRRGDVQGVDDTGQVGQAGQEDVDEEIGTAATLEEDTQRRQEDGKQDLADVAGGERHGDSVVGWWSVVRLVARRTTVVDGRCVLLFFFAEFGRRKMNLTFKSGEEERRGNRQFK